MYELKNYLLSIQSHWMINQPVYQAIQESVPVIARYRAKAGTEDLGAMPIQKLTKRVFPDVYRVPLFRRQYCKMLVEEIDQMRKVIGFEPNEDEDTLRQIPEIVLRDYVPELYRNMWFVVQNVLSPIIFSLYQREVSEIASVQIANYAWWSR